MDYIRDSPEGMEKRIYEGSLKGEDFKYVCLLGSNPALHCIQSNKYGDYIPVRKGRVVNGRRI